jgi:hypothetical protein
MQSPEYDAAIAAYHGRPYPAEPPLQELQAPPSYGMAPQELGNAEVVADLPRKAMLEDGWMSSHSG